MPGTTMTSASAGSLAWPAWLTGPSPAAASGAPAAAGAGSAAPFAAAVAAPWLAGAPPFAIGAAFAAGAASPVLRSAGAPSGADSGAAGSAGCADRPVVAGPDASSGRPRPAAAGSAGRAGGAGNPVSELPGRPMPSRWASLVGSSAGSGCSTDGLGSGLACLRSAGSAPARSGDGSVLSGLLGARPGCGLTWRPGRSSAPARWPGQPAGNCSGPARSPEAVSPWRSGRPAAAAGRGAPCPS
jgi:hypothetical protein